MKCRFCPEQAGKGRVCPECWHEPFNITSVCRADLEEYLSESQIAKFDDEGMEYLARKMADAYCDQGFWIDLEVIAKSILEDV